MKAGKRIGISTLLAGLGAGATLMYFFDPERGRRRRAHLGDLSRHYLREGKGLTKRVTRDSWHRAVGLLAEARSRLETRPLPDEVLVARVRSRMGRIVSHSHALSVTAEAGVVTLAGPVLEREVAELLRHTGKVPGVRGVENRLTVYRGSEHVPALQGGSRKLLAIRKRTPAQRLVIAATGGALTAFGLRRRFPIACAAGTLGLGLVGIGLMPRRIAKDEEEDIGWSSQGRGSDEEVNFYRMLHIRASMERVYRFWADVEDLSHFLTHVQEISNEGPGWLHWKLSAIGGKPIEWDAMITRQIPNQLLAWKSSPESQLSHSGMIHLEAHPRGGTRVHLRVTYRTPENAADLRLRDLLGPNPALDFEEDCRRIKKYLETGVPPQDTAERPAVGE